MSDRYDEAWYADYQARRAAERNAGNAQMVVSRAALDPGKANGKRKARRAARAPAKQIIEPRKRKYRNEPTVIDGSRFDSKKEAFRYQELLLLQRAGKIQNLSRQVKFSLDIEGAHIGNYFADFCYDDSDGNVIVEDTKGVRTKEYRLKAKLMKALYKMVILET